MTDLVDYEIKRLVPEPEMEFWTAVTANSPEAAIQEYHKRNIVHGFRLLNTPPTPAGDQVLWLMLVVVKGIPGEWVSRCRSVYGTVDFWGAGVQRLYADGPAHRVAAAMGVPPELVGRLVTNWENEEPRPCTTTVPTTTKTTTTAATTTNPSEIDGSSTSISTVS